MRGEIFGRSTAPLAAIAAAIFVLGVGFSVAQAQDTKPADTKPATTAPAPATTTPAPKTDAKADTKKATTKTTAAPSPCKGLEEAACTANTACSWHKEGKSKKGTAIAAHCQKKPAPAKKKTTTPTTPQ